MTLLFTRYFAVNNVSAFVEQSLPDLMRFYTSVGCGFAEFFSVWN